MLSFFDGQESTKGFSSRMDAVQELEEFLSTEPPAISVGQFVERRLTSKYKFPNDKQAAKCIARFEPELNGMDMEDMLIAVAIEKGEVRYFKVDSRHYRVANERRASIFKFGRR